MSHSHEVNNYSRSFAIGIIASPQPVNGVVIIIIVVTAIGVVINTVTALRIGNSMALFNL